MSETNKALVRRSFVDCINTGNLTPLNEILAPNYVYHDPTVGNKHGVQEFTEMINMYRTAFPDIKFTIEEQISEGNKVLTRWTCTATHKGNYMGIKPTGKQTKIDGMVVSTIENDRITNDFQTWDTFGLLAQIGALPATVRAAA